MLKCHASLRRFEILLLVGLSKLILANMFAPNLQYRPLWFKLSQRKKNFSLLTTALNCYNLWQQSGAVNLYLARLSAPVATNASITKPSLAALTLYPSLWGFAVKGLVTLASTTCAWHNDITFFFLNQNEHAHYSE